MAHPRTDIDTKRGQDPVTHQHLPGHYEIMNVEEEQQANAELTEHQARLANRTVGFTFDTEDAGEYRSSQSHSVLAARLRV